MAVRATLLISILLAVLPLTGVLAWRTAQDVREQRLRVDREVSASLEAVSTAIEGQLGSSLDALRVLSQSELFQQGRIAALGRLLQGKPRGDWDSVFLLDRDGAVVLDTTSGRTTPPMRDVMHDLAVRAVKSGEPAVSSFVDPVASPGSVVSIALPVMQGASVRYVLGARVTDATWQRLFATLSLPPGQEATLVDAQGQRIADTANSPRGEQVPADDPDLIAQWRALKASGWKVRVSMPLEPVTQAQRDVLLRAAAYEGGALLLGVALALSAAGLRLRRMSLPP